MKIQDFLFIIYLCFPFFVSCDKLDRNGDLDGQWQMYEWRSPNGEIVGNTELQIYYSFQLEMMMFQKLSVSSGYLLSSFQNEGNRIYVFDPIKYKGNGHDEILPMDTLMLYGVPLNGVMYIDSLTPRTLVLSSVETGRLCFRKY